jgi:hypothetical protein
MVEETKKNVRIFIGGFATVIAKEGDRVSGAERYKSHDGAIKIRVISTESSAGNESSSNIMENKANQK